MKVETFDVQFTNKWQIHSIKHIEAYVSPGDAGGYMGLLIGASCLTLCEVLDLFLYNCFLKLMDGYKRRRTTPVTGPNNDKATMGETDNHHRHVLYVDNYVKNMPKVSD